MFAARRMDPAIAPIQDRLPVVPQNSVNTPATSNESRRRPNQAPLTSATGHASRTSTAQGDGRLGPSQERHGFKQAGQRILCESDSSSSPESDSDSKEELRLSQDIKGKGMAYTNPQAYLDGVRHRLDCSEMNGQGDMIYTTAARAVLQSFPNYIYIQILRRAGCI